MKYAFPVFLLWVLTSDAWADADLDIVVKGGASAGTVFVPSANSDTLDKYSMGCIGVRTGVEKSLSPKYGAELDYGILLDTVNSQVSRQGVEGGLIYHVYGGARSVKQGDEAAGLISTSPSQISLLLLGSSESYSLVAKDLKLTVSGSVNEAKLGVYVRRNNWGAQLLLPFISISSSSSQLTSHVVDFNLIYLL